MATLSSSFHSNILSWITQLPQSPPASEDRRPLKRKRSSSEPTTMATRRDASPGKRKRPDEELLPGHSISVAGSVHPLSLSQYNTFSQPSGATAPRRGTSPLRDAIAMLENAFPPIITEPYDGVQLPPDSRDKVMAVMERLAPGQLEGWIPESFKELIKSDTAVGVQTFDRRAFSETPTCHPSDPDLHAEQQYTWRKVKDILQRARTCHTRGRDENAWCQVVIQPLVKLALKLSGRDKLLLQSVQSQVIESSYLSIDMKSSKRLEKKADFTLSYSHESPGFANLYARLQPFNSDVSHMSDAFTKTTALFAGIEAKASDGSKLEAEYQLSIWMAASLWKKAELARIAGLPHTTLLIEPAFVVVGHDWYFYLAYLHSEGAVHILKHGSCSTSSVSGVFKILRVLRNVIEYGVEGTEEEEGMVGFWGGFLGPVLERLAIENAMKV